MEPRRLLSLRSPLKPHTILSRRTAVLSLLPMVLHAIHMLAAIATERALWAVKEMLRRGFILLPEGEHANVISFTPPLTISERQLRTAVGALAAALSQR